MAYNGINKTDISKPNMDLCAIIFSKTKDFKYWIATLEKQT